jgi:hypothetical protein
MTTLTQIRKNKVENNKFKQKKHNTYDNPSSLAIISKIIKEENIKIINNISNENGLNKYEKQALLDKFIKPNYYIPYVVNSETKEKLQQLI